MVASIIAGALSDVWTLLLHEQLTCIGCGLMHAYCHVVRVHICLRNVKAR
jgi:hypothetical protein